MYLCFLPSLASFIYHVGECIISYHISVVNFATRLKYADIRSAWFSRQHFSSCSSLFILKSCDIRHFSFTFHPATGLDSIRL